MKELKAKKIARKILSTSGIRINGNRPYDIQVHNPDFYERVLAGGSLALGKTYMSGWWDCEALDQFFEKILETRLDRKVKINPVLFFWVMLKAKIINAQKQIKSIYNW